MSFACEVLVNGVKWLGRKPAVGSTATGTTMAACGTALAESVVTFVAVAYGVVGEVRFIQICRSPPRRWCLPRKAMAPRKAGAKPTLLSLG
jgi:hypothetical protein